MWYEYIIDTAQLLKREMPEKKIVHVTNGYINPEPLKKLLPYIDAMNIDFKGDNEFYKSICSGGSKAVMESIRLAYDMGVHVEVSTLIVGERNSDEKTLTETGEFIRSVNSDITLHI